MESSFNLAALILVLGAVQGVFLALLLFGRRDNKRANRLLGLLIISYTAFIVEQSLQGTQISRDLPHLIGLTSGFVFLIGPLHYIYARSLISPEKHLEKRDLLHAIPFVFFYLFFLVPFYLQSGSFKIEFMQSLEMTGPTASLRFFSWAVLFQGVIYMKITFDLLGVHAAHVKDEFSTVEKINLDWLRTITVITLVVWSLGIVIEVVQVFDPVTSLAGLVPAAISLLIYVMGYLGLRQPEIFFGGAPTESEEPKKYERSGLSRERAEEINAKLTDLMESEKLFTDSTLKLSQLARAIPTSPNNLSQVINEERQQNFYDFVNWYRIEEAKRMMLDPQHKGATLLAIAYSVGFNSKSTFNTAFRRNTGMAPSHFRKQHTSV